MEAWISTTKTILAASLGTMGFLVRTERSFDELSGKSNCVFHIAAKSLDGLIDSSGIKTQFDSGQLLRDQPEHPVLDICYAKQNRDRLLDSVNRGTRIELVKQAGTDRTFYRDGSGTSFPGIHGVSKLLETSDLNLVSALARFGVPVLEVRGPHGARKFYLDAQKRVSTLGREMAGDLMRDWRAKAVHAEHPICYPILGLVNYQRLVKSIQSDTEHVLIRKPNSIRAAIINPNMSGAGFDKMKRHFLG